MSLPAYDYHIERVVNGFITLIALSVLLATGSWKAIVVAIAFGVVGCALSRALEIWEHKA